MAGLGLHSTDRDRSTKVERGNGLHRRIEGWLTLQRLYAPKISLIRAESDDRDTSVLPPYQIPLLLPSSSVAARKCYDRRLLRFEFQFRVAEAETALKTIRGLLLYKAHMLNSKKEYAAGTVMMTRSNTLIQEIAAKIEVEVKHYRSSYSALQSLWEVLKTGSMRQLGDEAQWESVLHPLLDSDVVPITSLDGVFLGEGDKMLTWIWTVAGTGQDLNEVAHTGTLAQFSLRYFGLIIDFPALRIEFCRARARAQRWQEECLLVASEMVRAEKYFLWDAQRWEKRAEEAAVASKASVDPQLPKLEQWKIREQIKTARGKSAYAYRQAALRYNLYKKAVAEHAPWIPKLEQVPDIVEYSPAL